MSKWKRKLAALLAAVTLVSLLPATAMAAEGSAGGQREEEPRTAALPAEEDRGGTDPISLLPLEEYEETVDLRDRFPQELAAYPVKDFIEKINNEIFNEDYKIRESDTVSWAKGGKDTYTIVTKEERETAVIDLTPVESYSNSLTVELIVGTADQLNPENRRYMITVEVDVGRMTTSPFTFHVYAAGEGHSPITIYRSYVFHADGKTGITTYVDRTQWQYGQEACLAMELADSYKDRTGLEPHVYEGYFETEKEIPAGAPDIAETVWGANARGLQADYGGVKEEFTVVLKEDGATVAVVPFIAEMSEDGYGIGCEGIYADGDDGVRTRASSYSVRYDDDYVTRVIPLESGYSADAEYYLELYVSDPSSSGRKDVECVKKAVLGAFEDEAAAADQTDIKEQLFSNASEDGGYKGKFSEKMTFTFFMENGEVLYFSLRVEEPEPEEPEPEEPEPEEPVEPVLPPPPAPNAVDPYFRMESAKTADGTGLSCWAMPFDVDGYYYGDVFEDTNFGVQTIFLLNSDGSALGDGDIIPVFGSPSSVEIYASRGDEAATKQESGTSKVLFDADALQPIAYSARAANGEEAALKNYWVTFVTQQTGGAKLYVNAANIDAIKGEDGTPERVVHLDEAHNFYHDIFFANIGNEEMENISVELDEEAQKCVELDEYWTVRDDSVKKLAAFTTTSTDFYQHYYTEYAQLPNVAKIRILPKRDEAGNIVSGAISGTLTIHSSGGDQTIKLSGETSYCIITTETVGNGVKYVPFAQLIQTSAMGGDRASFTIAGGQLPDGITLEDTGLLYGVPMETGDFTVDVKADFGNGYVDQKTFTFSIAENTNENVWNATDEGYELTQWVGDGTADPQSEHIINSYEDTVFYSNGSFNEYVDFYLDGQKLTQGTDYIAESGSTKITLRAQTFRNAGNGKHTLAAEFHQTRNDKSTLKKANQNYTSTVPNSPSNGGNGGNWPKSYNVTIGVSTHGTVSATLRKAPQGSTVTVTVTPDLGYELDELVVTDSSGNNIPVTKAGENWYTFVMPGSDVSVNAAFVAQLYDVTTDVTSDGAHGTVSASPQTASKGSTVTVTVTPDRGYELDELVVTDSSGNNIPVTKAGENQYTFVMPDSDVSVNAAFVPMELDPNTSLPFFDVRSEDWFLPYVQDVYARGLMIGTSSDTFSPDAESLRGMIVVIFHRLAGEPEAEGSYFSDVQQDSYYAEAASWAAKNGVIRGYGDGRFGPNDPATREQIIVMLMRYAETAGYDVSARADMTQFSDSGAFSSSEAAEAASWAVAEGIIVGNGDGTVAPKAPATRAAVAAIFSRFYKLLEA